MVGRQPNTRGFTDQLHPCGPTLRPPQGLTCGLEICKLASRRNVTAASRAVIGPLTLTRYKPDAEPNRFMIASKWLRGHCVASASKSNHNFSLSIVLL